MIAMWKRLAPAVLALALLGGPPPARAAGPGFFDQFSALCLNHVFDAEGVKAEAAGQGFKASDREMADGPRKLEAFEKSAGGEDLLLGVNATVRPGMGPIPESNAVTCGLYSSASDPDAAGQAARWFGVPEDASHSTPEAAYFFFYEIDGVRTPMPYGADQPLIDGLKKGRIWMAVVNRGADDLGIMISVFQASGR